jgi:hypothetical protein
MGEFELVNVPVNKDNKSVGSFRFVQLEIFFEIETIRQSRIAEGLKFDQWVTFSADLLQFSRVKQSNFGRWVSEFDIIPDDRFNIEGFFCC